MYILQERDIHTNVWEDITKSNEYDFILELCRLYNEKYSDCIYRVIEVYYSV